MKIRLLTLLSVGTVMCAATTLTAHAQVGLGAGALEAGSESGGFFGGASWGQMAANTFGAGINEENILGDAQFQVNNVSQNESWSDDATDDMSTMSDAKTGVTKSTNDKSNDESKSLHTTHYTLDGTIKFGAARKSAGVEDSAVKASDAAAVLGAYAQKKGLKLDSLVVVKDGPRHAHISASYTKFKHEKPFKKAASKPRHEIEARRDDRRYDRLDDRRLDDRRR